MAFAPPGGNNTYIPRFDLAGSIVVDFTRNPKKFAINKLVKSISVEHQVGKYMYWDQNDIARFKSGNTDAYKWAPGSSQNPGVEESFGFEFREYRTQRRRYGSQLDQLGVDQASFPVLESYTKLLAQKAMTGRAIDFSTLITTSGNHTSGHYSASTALGTGGKWDTGTATNPVLKKGLDAAAQIIQRDTVSAVDWSQLTIVMNSKTAQALSATAEIHSYLQQSQYALAQVKGLVDGQNARWGLPDTIYGYRVAVEDLFYNDDNKLSSSVQSTPVFPDDTLVMMLRDGDQEGQLDSVNFSTVSMFVKEDMSVQTLTNDWERNTLLRVVDDYQMKMVAPVTAYLVTDVLS